MRRTSALIAMLTLGLVLTSCGSSGSGAGSATTSGSVFDTHGFKSPQNEPLTGGKHGGTLEVLNETDFEHLDPGPSYYSVDYEVVYATQRPLYSYMPNDTIKQTPDMAAGPPQITDGGKLVTIQLRKGVHFSPPVNREVTAEDVAYAIERGANPNVANPYMGYYRPVEGMPNATGGPVKGITTPDKHTIVFKLTEPKGKIMAEATTLPLSAPVPREYAEKYDRHKPSDYGNYQVATGPYMIKNDSSGKVLGVGYFPGKSLTLVRNPNWDASTDIRPAYLDEIRVKIGGSNTVIGKQVLAGTNVVQNEPPAQANVKLAAEHYKDQLEISPGAGDHYISVNNKYGPFKNIDLRKAVWAAMPREAMIKTRGGRLVADPMTHFIYPGTPGFEKAGGAAGPQFDYNEHPNGDMTVATKYMKLAGYPSGKYTGGETLSVVGQKGSPAEQSAEIVNSTLKSLGFKTNLTLVEPATMYAKFCNVPKEKIDVCPSVGWINDFGDPQASLDITFNGKNIVSTGNTNWGLTDVPKINAAIEKAEPIVDQAKREAAWAAIDREVVENAAAVPFEWDKQANIEGSGVNGVGDAWDVGEWDYSWTSLK